MRFVALLVLIWTFLPTPIQAGEKEWEGPYWSDESASPWYLGGGLGISHLDPSEQYSDWNVKDDESSGYKLFIGRRFADQWAFELGYVEPGLAALSNIDVTITDQAEIDYNIPSLTMNYYFRQPNKYWNLYAKAGVAVVRNDLQDGTPSSLIPPPERTTTEAALGLGLHWNITERGFLRVEADSYGSDAWFVSVQLGVYFEGHK